MKTRLDEIKRFQKLAGIKSSKNLLESYIHEEDLSEEELHEKRLYEKEGAEEFKDAPNPPAPPAPDKVAVEILNNPKIKAKIKTIKGVRVSGNKKAPQVAIDIVKNDSPTTGDKNKTSTSSTSTTTNDKSKTSTNSTSTTSDSSKQLQKEEIATLTLVLAAPLLAKGFAALSDWIFEQVNSKSLRQEQIEGHIENVLELTKDLQKEIDDLPKKEKVSPNNKNKINAFIEEHFHFHGGDVHEDTDKDREAINKAKAVYEKDRKPKIPIHLRGQWIKGNQFAKSFQKIFGKTPQNEKEFIVGEEDTNQEADLKCQMLVDAVKHFKDQKAGTWVGRAFRWFGHKAHDAYVNTVGAAIMTFVKGYLLAKGLEYQDDEKKIVDANDTSKDLSGKYAKLHKYLSNEKFREHINSAAYCIFALGASAEHIVELGTEAAHLLTGSGAKEVVEVVGGEGALAAVGETLNVAITAAKTGKTVGEVISSILGLT